MQNLKSTQNSKNSGAGWKLFVAVAVVGMIGATIITVHNVRNRSASQTEGAVAGKGEVAVAVATTDIPAGGTFDGSYSIIPISENAVPVNAIKSASEFDGGVAAISVGANTVLTQSMVVHTDLDENTDNTSRLIAINYVTLDTGVEEGDYIDIRLKKFGSEEGLTYEDDVVLAKKKIHAISGQEITLSLSEKEQLALGVATVDASLYGEDGSEKTALLYSTRYVDASQQKAVETYENAKLSALIDSNPNLIAEAQRQLAQKQAALVQQKQQVPAENSELKDDSGVEAK